jgi:hypothetical protein
MGDRVYPPYLRLVWSRPARPVRPRINLAQAIERHLAGDDGLTDQQFVVLHATGTLPVALPLVPPS